MTEVSNLGNPGNASVTPAASTPAPIATPDTSPLGTDVLDMDAMKEFSRSQAEQKLAKDPNIFGIIKGKKNEKESKEPEVEETLDEEVEGEDGAEEAPLPDAAKDSDDEEDSEDEEEGSPEEVADGEEVDGRKYVVAKAGDKALRIPKGATLEVKVNGKIEPITVQEALNRASGVIHIERETARIGRDSKALEQKQSDFSNKARIVNENASILMELCEKGSPEDVAGFYAQLLGKDPNEVYEGIIRNALIEAQKYEGLTEPQIRLMHENRRLKLERDIAARRAHSAQLTKTQETERNAVVSEMKKRGVSSEDWDKYANEAATRLKAGEIDLEIKSAYDVLNYIVERKHEDKVDSAITSVDKNLARDSNFRGRISEAVSKTEALHKRVMSPKEVQAFVKQAVEIDRKAFSDTLSKKADRVVKSGRPTSQNGKPQKQEKKRGPFTLQEHYDRVNGIG